MTRRPSQCGRAVTLVTLAALLAVVPAMAELTVIHEAPGTRPLSDFLGTSGQTPTPRPLPQAPAAWDLRTLLPIHSPGLSPGPVAARAQQLSLAQPVFLIGADALSKAWLARHRARLEALGAIGLLVEAETQADLEAIAELAGVLPIVPTPATDLGVCAVETVICDNGAAASVRNQDAHTLSSVYAGTGFTVTAQPSGVVTGGAFGVLH